MLSRASHANGGVGGEVPGGQGGDGDLRIDRSLPMRQAAAAAAEAAAAASLGRGSTPQVWSSSLLSPPPTPSERLQRLYYPCDEDEDGIDDGSHMDVLNSNGNGNYNDGNESAGYRDVGGGGAGVTAGQSGSGSSVGGVDGLSVANAQGDLALPPRTRSAPPLPMLPASHAGAGLLRGGCSADGGGVGCGETRAASGGPGAVPGVAVGGGGVVPFRRRKVVLQDAAVSGVMCVCGAVYYL